MTVIMILCMVAASKLEPPVEAEKWFSSDHMQEYAKMQTIWGVKELDREADNFNPYIPSENRGKVVYDDSFDIYKDSTQNAILDACTLMNAKTCNAQGCEGGKLFRPSTVICPLAEFHTWHN